MVTNTITFKLHSKTELEILNQDEETIGIIKSGDEGANNVVNISGFSESFKLWASENFAHAKQINLLFDDKKLKGKMDVKNCNKCFHKPCQCENNKMGDIISIIQNLTATQKETLKKLRAKGDMEGQVRFLIDSQGLNPFNVKSKAELETRLKVTKEVEEKSK